MFNLEQNYPNPFNPTTVVSCQSPVACGWSCMICLVERWRWWWMKGRSRGNYSVEFDASGLASGVYFCRMTADAFVGTKRMLLLR